MLVTQERIGPKLIVIVNILIDKDIWIIWSCFLDFFVLLWVLYLMVLVFKLFDDFWRWYAESFRQEDSHSYDNDCANDESNDDGDTSFLAEGDDLR